MKKLLVSLALGLLAVSASADTLTSAIESLTENCSGNGDGASLGRFNAKKFDAAKEMREFKKFGNCPENMMVSKSRSEGISSTLSFLEKEECTQEYLSHAQLRALERTIKDPTNLAVFSSEYDGGGESEYCSQYYFRIYKANGTRIDIGFDYTD